MASGLSYGQLEYLWEVAGGSPDQAPLAAAVAEAESGGSPQATGELNNNPSTGDYSVGPWQINYFGDLLAPRTQAFGAPAKLENDPLADAKAAVAISDNGANFNAWTTYTGGAYQNYLQSGVAATPSGGAGTATLPSPFGTETGILGGISSGLNSAGSAITGAASGAASAVTSPITGPVDAATKAANEVGTALSSVGTDFSNAFSFVFSLRFVEILGGAALVIVGLVIVGRQFVTGPVASARSAVAG